MYEILAKLKEAGIMAAVIRRDGVMQASNFNLPDGAEMMSTVGFNIGDQLLRELKDEGEEMILTTDKGNVVLKKMGDEVLLSVITTQEQYDFYKSLMEKEKK